MSHCVNFHFRRVWKICIACFTFVMLTHAQS
eukprot:SAG25_NODE_8419_length_423_cov_1.104938_1_plen_30_part_01